MSDRNESTDDGGDPNAWMATFSDLVTLLITFFVLLLSMSSLDAKALEDTFGVFEAKVGALDNAASTSMVDERIAVTMPPIMQRTLDDESEREREEEPKALEETESDVPEATAAQKKTARKATSEVLAALVAHDRNRIEDMLDEGNGRASRKQFLQALEILKHPRYEGVFTLVSRGDKVLVGLAAELLFVPGRVMIEPRSLVLLREVGKLLGNFDTDIRVVAVEPGPNAPAPIRTALYATQRDLAVARACNVVRYMTTSVGSRPGRLGCGVARPGVGDGRTGVYFELSAQSP